MKKSHYGYYGLPILGAITGVVLLIGILIVLFISELFGWIVVCFGLYILISHGISLFLTNQRLHAYFPDILKIEGNEYVLDVGCGLGRMSIAVAKRLKNGRVVGIDIWDKKMLWDNSSERTYINAEIEGVKEKVEFKYGNIFKIPFPDNTFDLVTCSSVLNNLRGNAKKLRALSEIYRVLKPGGRFLLIEPLRCLRMFFLFTPFAFWQLLTKEDWSRLLKRTGFESMKYQRKDGVAIFLLEK